ncbi:hypothetical protein [Salinigranum halophilum]|jgi:predicted SprT family Zn-dependent metalloprotease|uniref:hypothetical protein n=1 Tax=Salinigranum halophilum TaxID=2565931 RepID=UPI0010A88B9D|nr:hypothetical protein [Salinigranum halophilum]
MTSAPTVERHPARTTRRRRSPAAPSADERSKALLFCACGREAPTDEWRVERDGRRRRLVCPDCRETLTVR